MSTPEQWTALGEYIARVAAESVPRAFRVETRRQAAADIAQLQRDYDRADGFYAGISASVTAMATNLPPNAAAADALRSIRTSGVQTYGELLERALRIDVACRASRRGRSRGSTKNAEQNLFIAVLAAAILRVDPTLDTSTAIRGAIRLSTPGLPKRDDGGLPFAAPGTHERRIRRTLEQRRAEIDELLRDVPANEPGQRHFVPGFLTSKDAAPAAA
jgi:hypothetical protein